MSALLVEERWRAEAHLHTFREDADGNRVVTLVGYIAKSYLRSQPIWRGVLGPQLETSTRARGGCEMPASGSA